MATATAVGTEIVERIASREGVDPTDLDRPLSAVIDVDALATLTTESRTRSLQLSFSYYGYTVTVDGTGQISIEEQVPGVTMGDTPTPSLGDD